MNENIDIIMSNYLAILGNPELRKNFDPSVIHAMESVIAIYTAKTSKAYLEEYKASSRLEEVGKAFK